MSIVKVNITIKEKKEFTKQDTIKKKFFYSRYKDNLMKVGVLELYYICTATLFKVNCIW